MKKLIVFALSFLMFVFIACSKGNKSKQEFPIYNDYWVEIGTKKPSDSEIKFVKYDSDEDLSYNNFILFKPEVKEVSSGYLDYYSYRDKLEIEYYDNEKLRYDKLSNKLFWRLDTIYTDIYKIKLLTKDTLALLLKEYDSLGVRIPDDYIRIFKRRNLYSSSEAKALLVKQKLNLDLELISQKKYDSVKNVLSKYILTQ